MSYAWSDLVEQCFLCFTEGGLWEKFEVLLRYQQIRQCKA
jgi:hypothetical protein